MILQRLNMEAVDLVAREKEFKKLNKQLEKKTESLMKEIEHAMQKQDIFSEFGSLTLSPNHRQTKKHCCDSHNVPTPKKEISNTKKYQKIDKQTNSDIKDNNKDATDNTEKNNCIVPSTCCMLSCNKKINNDLEFLYAFVSINVKDNVLPQVFLKDKATVENVCKFLSAKVKLMQEQIDKLQATINKKVKQCEGHMTQLAELESERLTLLNTANNMRSETVDVKTKYAAMLNRLNEKDRLYKEQRSGTDRLTSELKTLKKRNITLEARCASQEELISNLKQQLEMAKISEKEFRDSTRSLSASHQTSINRLESKMRMFQTHIDKQMSLIDNLKRQNALLTTEGAIKALERDYDDFLNQDL